MSWFDDPNNKDAREFVEAGGYGEFKGWNSYGFTTANGHIPGRGYDRIPVTNAEQYLPPSGSHFAGGKYMTIAGTDQRLAPPGYQVIHVDKGYSESLGDGANPAPSPGRLILKRTSEASADPRPDRPSEVKPDPKPEINLDTKRIEDALRAARPYETAYNKARRPMIGYSKDIVQQSAQYGADTGNLVDAWIDRSRGRSKVDTAETGSALDYGIAKFNGTLPKLDWEKWYDKFKGDLASA